jgi:hypothetical protein
MIKSESIESWTVVSKSGLKTDFTRRFQPAKCVTRPLGEMRASHIYNFVTRSRDAVGEKPSAAAATVCVCVIRQYNYVRSRRGAKLSSFKKGAQKEPMVPRTNGRTPLHFNYL